MLTIPKIVVSLHNQFKSNLMKKTILILSVLAVIAGSCKETAKQQTTEISEENDIISQMDITEKNAVELSAKNAVETDVHNQKLNKETTASDKETTASSKETTASGKETTSTVYDYSHVLERAILESKIDTSKFSESATKEKMEEIGLKNDFTLIPRMVVFKDDGKITAKKYRTYIIYNTRYGGFHVSVQSKITRWFGDVHECAVKNRRLFLCAYCHHKRRVRNREKSNLDPLPF